MTWVFEVATVDVYGRLFGDGGGRRSRCACIDSGSTSTLASEAGCTDSQTAFHDSDSGSLRLNLCCGGLWLNCVGYAHIPDSRLVLLLLWIVWFNANRNMHLYIDDSSVSIRTKLYDVHTPSSFSKLLRSTLRQKVETR